MQDYKKLLNGVWVWVTTHRFVLTWMSMSDWRQRREEEKKGKITRGSISNHLRKVLLMNPVAV